jgi:hypothetical protein
MNSLGGSFLSLGRASQIRLSPLKIHLLMRGKEPTFQSCIRDLLDEVGHQVQGLVRQGSSIRQYRLNSLDTFISIG